MDIIPIQLVVRAAVEDLVGYASKGERDQQRLAIPGVGRMQFAPWDQAHVELGRFQSFAVKPKAGVD